MAARLHDWGLSINQEINQEIKKSMNQRAK
jgi:hypothetical protein